MKTLFVCLLVLNFSVNLSLNHETYMELPSMNQPFEGFAHAVGSAFNTFNNFANKVGKVATNGVHAFRSFIDMLKKLRQFLNENITRIIHDCENLLQKKNNIPAELLLLPKAFSDVITAEKKLLTEANELVSTIKLVITLPLPFIGSFTKGINPYLHMYPSFKKNFQGVIDNTIKAENFLNDLIVPQVKRSGSSSFSVPSSAATSVVNAYKSMARNFRNMAQLVKNAAQQSDTHLALMRELKKIMLYVSTSFDNMHDFLVNFANDLNVPSSSSSDSGNVKIDWTNGLDDFNKQLPEIIHVFRETQHLFGPIVNIAAALL